MEARKKRKLTENEKVVQKITKALHAQFEAKIWRDKYYEAVKDMTLCNECGTIMCAACEKKCKTCKNVCCDDCLKYCSKDCYHKVCTTCGPHCKKHTPEPIIEKAE
jgi:hypothetical protein